MAEAGISDVGIIIAPETGDDGRMESSLLGRDGAIRRGDRQSRAYRFMVGDKSEIGIL